MFCSGLLVGTRLIADTGYRGNGLNLTTPGIVGDDYNCIAWTIDEGTNKHWEVRSCSNQQSTGRSAEYVEGFVCQIDLGN